MVEKMIEGFNDRIVNWLIREGSITEEEREVYKYGIRGLTERGITLTAMLLIIIISKCIITGIVFTISFKCLRKYAGGYHAASYMKCFILSDISFIMVIALVKYNVLGIVFYRVVGAVSAASLYYIKPLDSPDKPLTRKEKQIYYKKEKITICIMTSLCIIMYILRLTELEKIIESSAILNGITSIYEIVRRKIYGSVCMR